MAGYSGKSVVQKLGIMPGFCIFLWKACPSLPRYVR
jgi:hypothetical protein